MRGRSGDEVTGADADAWPEGDWTGTGCTWPGSNDRCFDGWANADPEDNDNVHRVAGIDEPELVVDGLPVREISFGGSRRFGREWGG